MFAPKRYKIVYGGRAGGKTHAFARALLILAMQKPVRIANAREVWTSIRESSYQVFVDAIFQYGLNLRNENGIIRGFFDVKKSFISGRNGSYIFFLGLSDRTHTNVRGLEKVHYLWYDEAQQMEAKTRESLYPSIRAPGSEIWLSFNPGMWSDPVCQDFLQPSARRNQAWVKKVLYYHNYWLPAEMEQERNLFLHDQPERYAHVWLGEPDMDGDKRKVLPESLIQLILSAWHLSKGAEKGQNSRIWGGLDVADTGGHQNVLVRRQGGIIQGVSAKYSEFLGDTARWANKYCNENKISRLFFDGGGVGAGIRSHMRDINPQGYSVYPVLFGSSPMGGKTYYSFGVTNAEFFSYLNAQLAWNLRLRAINTQALVKGHRKVDPRSCLFIDPNIPNLQQYILELSQPEWKTNNRDQIVIDKQPDGADSPDMYDATILSFAHDIRNGLEEGRRRT